MLKGISDGVVCCHLIFQEKPYFRAYHINKRDERFTHPYAPKQGTGYGEKRSENAQPQNEILCSIGAWGALPSTSRRQEM